MKHYLPLDPDERTAVTSGLAYFASCAKDRALVLGVGSLYLAVSVPGVTVQLLADPRLADVAHKQAEAADGSDRLREFWETVATVIVAKRCELDTITVEPAELLENVPT